MASGRGLRAVGDHERRLVGRIGLGAHDQRKWRQWLTTNILGDWLANERYRRLESASGEYKNAEYRISYDAKSATDSPVDLTLGLVNSVLTASIFTSVLWTVGGGLTFPVGRLEVTVPGYLVIAAVLYALLFTGLMLLIGRNLPAVIQLQSQGEAEFLAAANQSPAVMRQATATLNGSMRFGTRSARCCCAGANWSGN